MMPKKGANRKPQTCLTQKTAKPSPSISNLHPPFSTRSLWIKGQTFRVKMEDLLCQPAGRDAKAFGEMPRWPCWVFVGKNTAPPLCHPSLSAKHCGFALHDIQDEPSKAKTMLHVFIRFSNDSAPDSDHKDIMRFLQSNSRISLDILLNKLKSSPFSIATSSASSLDPGISRAQTRVWKLNPGRSAVRPSTVRLGIRHFSSSLSLHEVCRKAKRCKWKTRK